MTSSNEPQSPEESSPRSRRPLLMAAAAVVVALLGWAIYQSGNEPEPARSGLRGDQASAARICCST